MPDFRKVKNVREQTQMKSIEAHAGFVRYFSGKAEKMGVENIMRIPASSPDYFLKEGYLKVIDFAEKIQIKEIAQKVATEDENGKTIPLMVYLPQVTSES